MRFLRLISLLVIFALAGALDLNAQQGGGETPFDEGIINSAVTGAGAMDMFAGFVGDTLYLPVGMFTNQLGLKQWISDNLDTIDVEFPVNTPIRFIRSAGTITRRDSTSPLAAGVIREYDGELYMRHDILLKTLGITAYFDMRRLRLDVGNDSRIPAIQRAANRERYAALHSLEKGEQLGGESAPRGMLLGSALVSWSASGAFLDKTYQAGSLSGHLAGPFLYGTVDLDAYGRHGGRGNEISYGVTQGRWSLPLIDFSPLRRITLGFTPTQNAVPDFSLGLSNLRLVAPRNLATRDLTGTTMPGWDVELYEGTRLIEVTKADSAGRYSFALPVGYGQVTRFVHEVGTHGERIITERKVGLPIGSTLPGEIQYDAIMTRRMQDQTASYLGTLRMSAGLLDWLNIGATAHGGASKLDAALLDSIEIDPVVNVWMGSIAALELRGSPRWKSLGGTLDLAFSTLSRLSITAQTSLPTKETEIRGGFDLPIGHVSLNLLGQYQGSPSGTAYSLAPRISGGFSDLYMMATTTFGLNDAMVSGVPGTIDAPRGVQMISSTRISYRPWHWVNMQVGGAYDHTRKEFGGWNVSTTTNIGSLNLGLQYSAEGTNWRQGSLQAQLSFDMGIARSRTTSMYERDQLASATTLDGAFSISSAGLSIEPSGSLGVATVIVNPFVDRNLNGKRDAGEDVDGQVRARIVSVDGTSSNSNGGRFASVRPYIEWYVQIDQSSLADQGLTPVRSEFTVFSLPSTTHVLDIPFAEGNDISGLCEIELPNGKRKTSAGTLNGLRVRLVSLNGVASYPGEVFFDGSILVSGVAPGEYRLEFDQQQLDDRLIALKDLPSTIIIAEKELQLPLITFIPAPSKRVN